MWDQFRKAAPTVAAVCSATKALGAAMLDGESFATAKKAAEKKYNNALQSNKLKTAMNHRVDKAQEVVEAIVDELGFGNKLASSKAKLASKEKPAAKKKATVKKPAVAKKAKPAVKKNVAAVKEAKSAVKKVVAKVAKKSTAVTKSTIVKAKSAVAKKPAKKK